MSAKKIIKFVTGNSNKLKEVASYLEHNEDIELENIALDLPEYQGNPDDVSVSKCKEAARQIHGPVLIEDTCLGFNAMGGLPGPYIKWFQRNLGPDGLHRMLYGWDDKSATALCTFAYHTGREGDAVILFRGECHGKIVSPSGPRTFSWDPIFQPDGYDETFAEMSQELKNSISHRGNALSKLSEYFSNSKKDDL